ncbi:MAG: hypothetical protein IJF24_01300 [Clostridia bacterium]|nr:hypothetical protein [Clostridia bacterium]
MPNEIICHIPHASRAIPAWVREVFCVSEEELQTLLDFMTDADVDGLWSFVPCEDRAVCLRPSRCAVFRFSDRLRVRLQGDEKTILAHFGAF